MAVRIGIMAFGSLHIRSVGDASVFYGNYKNVIDSKGRVFVPAKWRADLGDSVIVMRGMSEEPDDCFLTAMSEEQFSHIWEALASIHPMNLKYRDAARELFQFATQCEVDKQGRILIAQHLLDYAGITTEAALTASVNCFELWEPSRLEAKNRSYSRKKLAQDCQTLANEASKPV